MRRRKGFGLLRKRNESRALEEERKTNFFLHFFVLVTSDVIFFKPRANDYTTK